MKKRKPQTENWHVIRILPELQMTRAFECRDVALVPRSDLRLIQAAARNASVRYMLQGFPNSKSADTWPCALILREGSRLDSLEALVEFRNIVAVCCMLHSWMASIPALNVTQPIYSQQFDFYPYHPTKDPKLLLSTCFGKDAGIPATRGFRGQLNDSLPMHFNYLNGDVPSACRSLLERMMKVWEDYYYRRKTAVRRKCIRAFSAAYAAFRGPDYTSLPMHDYGIQAAFWVSALETLAQPKKAPGRKPSVNINHVLDLLEGKCVCSLPSHCDCFIPDRDFLRTRRGKVRKNDPPRNRNYMQRLYQRLYTLRNRCLHGSLFGRTEIWPKKVTKRSLAGGVGPVLFFIAARQHLCQAGYQSPVADSKTLFFGLRKLGLPQGPPSRRRSFGLRHFENTMANRCLEVFKRKRDAES